MSDAARLRETAELFVKLAAGAGRELAFDEGGVRWAAAYVEGIRPVEREDQRTVQGALVGSFLGEAIIATYGGAWARDDAGEWSVELPGGSRVYPVRRALQHIDEGPDDTILGLFTAIPELAGVPAPERPETDSPAGDPAAPLKETAERLRTVIAANGGPAEYGAAMVAFVDEFVENARPVEAELTEQYTALVGAVLGESLVAAYAGEWRQTGDAWIVRLPGGTAVWPFAAARKQLEGGPDDSILALFRQADPGPKQA